MLRRSIHRAARGASLALAATLSIWFGGSLAHAGTLEGQVVHQGGPAQLKGLPIRLVSPKSGGFDDASTTTAADGRFRFEGLTEVGPHFVFVEYKDITYPPEVVRLEKPDATSQVRLEVFDPVEDGSKLRISEIKMVIGRGEAGVYRVQHLIGLENSDRSVLRRGKEGTALARFGLLPNRTGEIGASLDMFSPADLTSSDDGVAEFRGPVFPGTQQLLVSYEIDAGGRDLLTELSFPEPLGRFELYVRDEGLAIYAQPLHPAPLHVEREQNKPVPYQSYLGFDIAAGTRIPLRLETLPEAGASQVLAAALVAVLFGLLGVFVGLPIVAGARAPRRERDAEASDGPPEALISALADLEHDFEMGKVSEGDRERLREELRREAVEAMARRRAEKARPARTARVEPKVGVCSCGQEAAPAARFCSACGRKLE